MGRQKSMHTQGRAETAQQHMSARYGTSVFLCSCIRLRINVDAHGIERRWRTCFRFVRPHTAHMGCLAKTHTPQYGDVPHMESEWGWSKLRRCASICGGHDRSLWCHMGSDKTEESIFDTMSRQLNSSFVVISHPFDLKHTESCSS